MLVDCPDCARSYHLGADDLGARGRVLVCPRCDARWFQQSEGAAVVPQPGADIRPSYPIDSVSGSGALTSMLPGLGGLRTLLVVGLLASSTAATIGKRDLVVRTMPRTARIFAATGLPVNVRGLDFARVVPRATATEDATIGGEIRNVSGRRVSIPRIAFEVRDATGATLMSWSENAPAASLAGGRTIAFRSEPHRLPPEGRTAVVRFEGDDGPPMRLARTTF